MSSLISTIKIQDKTTHCFQDNMPLVNFPLQLPLSTAVCLGLHAVVKHAPGTGVQRKKQARAFGTCPFGALIQASEKRHASWREIFQINYYFPIK